MDVGREVSLHLFAEDPDYVEGRVEDTNVVAHGTPEQFTEYL